MYMYVCVCMYVYMCVTHAHTHPYIQRGVSADNPRFDTPDSHRPFENGQRSSNHAADTYDNVAGDVVVPIRGMYVRAYVCMYAFQIMLLILMTMLLGTWLFMYVRAYKCMYAFRIMLLILYVC